MTDFRRTRVVPWRLDAGSRRIAAWHAVMRVCNWEVACGGLMGVSKAACGARLGAAPKQDRGATRSCLSARRISAERGHKRRMQARSVERGHERRGLACSGERAWTRADGRMGVRLDECAYTLMGERATEHG
ncbi:hypothetical protein Syun_016279 [Stephania yunnanensis]|uniref:Uncharacterized protein n=1 Tax=Stephania yunnanensis TaxID=152371 RepID=A0AAP0J4I9_9MAGN